MAQQIQKRVLFISSELIAADLAHCLTKEGVAVKLYIKNISDRSCFDGMVEKTKDWKKELSWVGKNGLIIFDDVGYGQTQDDLRKNGYLVVGGSADGDNLETNRDYGQEILKKSGVPIDKDFKTITLSIDKAIQYILKRKGAWVIKPNDHNTFLTFVSVMKDGCDAVSVLESYKTTFGGEYKISIQKKVEGVEIAVGRFFNGNDWVGPIVINREHKHFCNNEIGPLGGETGTLMWYEKNENNKLFQKTLAKLKTHLQKSSYRGYIDVNCIVMNKNILYPLEITSRFGSSTNQLQSEINSSKWFNFLYAIAKGKDYKLSYNVGIGINVAITVPPFPYRISKKSLSQKGMEIFFSRTLSKKEMSSIHFEEVSKVEEKNQYFVAGNSGYILYITAVASTVEKARDKVYSVIEKIYIPKMFYRTDIGLTFVYKEMPLLKKWEWI